MLLIYFASQVTICESSSPTGGKLVFNWIKRLLVEPTRVEYCGRQAVFLRRRLIFESYRK